MVHDGDDIVDDDDVMVDDVDDGVGDGDDMVDDGGIVLYPRAPLASNSFFVIRNFRSNKPMIAISKVAPFHVNRRIVVQNSLMS